MPVTSAVMLTVVPICRAHFRSARHPGRAASKERENAMMKVHEFTLILTADPNEEEADRLYGIFNDGTLSTLAGIPQIHFHREAPALEEALRSAIAHVRAAGFEVERVEIEPEAVTQPA